MVNTVWMMFTKRIVCFYQTMFLEFILRGSEAL